MHHYAEVFAERPSIHDDPPLWSSLPTPTARAAALRENRGHRLNCHEDTRSLQQCRRSFVDASGCLNPDFGQLGDDGEAYRRWQPRMIQYRREDKPSRSNKKKQKHTRRRRGNSRGQHQSQGQHNTHNDGYNTHAERDNQQSGPGHDGGVPPSLRCLTQPWRKPEAAPARHLPHW